MASRAKLNEVVREIFVRMYEEATPPAQYPREVKSYEDHYLSHERQKQIVDEVMKEHKITSQPDRIAIRSTVYTGGVPNTIARISTSVG